MKGGGFGVSALQWLGVILITISTGFLTLSLYFLWVWSRYRPPHSGKCYGYLRNQQYAKEKWIAKRKVKNWVDYVYTYTVDGKLYFIKDGVHGKNENLPKSVTVVYQKKHPKRAYIEKMTFPHEPVWIAAAGLLALLFLIFGIVVML